MLQAACRAPALLGPSARHVAAFVRSQRHPDGGFRGRADASDLYYAVFALEALLALGAELPRESVGAWLSGLGPCERLDFVHCCCLARAWASIEEGGPPPATRAAVLERLGTFRTPDGGYGPTPGAGHGTAYGCFLALGAWGDCRGDVPDADGLVACLGGLRTADGGYANEPGRPVGSTPATAGAAVVLRCLGRDVPPAVADWLLGRHALPGGFLAGPAAPMPDLLSTATALHALGTLGAPLAAIGERCLDFLDSLWDPRGGFRGSWADDALDCEYTYYGLLALGHLSM